MTSEIFDDLLTKFKNNVILRKKSTIMQDPMPPNIKYEATIRFLSTGLIMLNCNIYFGYIKAQSVNLYQRFVRQFTRD